MDETNGFNEFVAGALSGLIANVAGFPFDTLKVRAQTQKVQVSVLDNARHIFKVEGARGFFRGITPPLILKMGTTGLAFGAFGWYRALLSKPEYVVEETGDVVLPIWKVGLAGALTGITLSPLITPAENIKIQIQEMGARLAAGKPTPFETPLGCIRAMAASKETGGIRLAWRGGTATTLRLMPGWGVYFAGYDFMNRHWVEDATLGANNVTSISSTVRVLSCGVAAGAAAWVTSIPLDVVKTRMQAQPIEKKTNMTVVSVTKDIYRAEGVRGFFRGLAPALLRSAPTNAAQFMFFEVFYKVVVNFREELDF